MRIDIYASPDLLAAHSKDVEAVLRKAVRGAMIEHKRAGNTVVAWNA